MIMTSVNDITMLLYYTLDTIFYSPELGRVGSGQVSPCLMCLTWLKLCITQYIA